MNACLITVIVPRSTFISSYKQRYNNSYGSNTNIEGRHYVNQHHNHIQNRDRRKVSLNSHKVAATSVDEYNDAHNQDYEDQDYYGNGEQLDDDSYDEHFDEPETNNVQAEITKCTVCEAEGDHKTWECPIVENVRTEALQRCIQ